MLCLRKDVMFLLSDAMLLVIKIISTYDVIIEMTIQSYWRNAIFISHNSEHVYSTYVCQYIRFTLNLIDVQLYWIGSRLYFFYIFIHILASVSKENGKYKNWILLLNFFLNIALLHIFIISCSYICMLSQLKKCYIISSISNILEYFKSDGITAK